MIGQLIMNFSGCLLVTCLFASTVLSVPVVEDEYQFLEEFSKSIVDPPQKSSLPKRGNAKLASYSVQTTHGLVKGYHGTTARGNTSYTAYVGIPYAKPPVGNLRFKAPVTADPWTDEKIVDTEGNSCWNEGENEERTSEDCLVLNVFTQVNTEQISEPLRAVLVFIHGGAYVTGSSSIYGYNPDFLLDKDVVFASLNYRLGPLGFLSLQNEDAPGNAGLKDQSLALRWIKQNIEKFGGDPNRIVVFGQSAGSGSASYQQMSLTNAGLFNGVILQSGTAMCPWSYTPAELAVQHAETLGKLVGCNTTTIEELHECLLEASPAVLSELQHLVLTPHEIYHLLFFPFAPTIEPDLPGAFMSKSSLEVLTSGDFNHVPVIVGVNSREALMILPIFETLDPTGRLTFLIGLDKMKFVPYDLGLNMSSQYSDQINKMISDFYFEGGQITLDQRQNLIDAGTDTHFNIDIQRVTLLLAEHSTAPVYNYRFTYEGAFNGKLTSSLADDPGATHGDELGYIFNRSYLQDLYAQSPDRNSPPQIRIDEMTEMWTNFAKYGNPTPNTDGYVKTIWKPFSLNEHNYLDIGEQLVLKQGLQSESMKFWNDVYDLVEQRRPLPE